MAEAAITPDALTELSSKQRRIDDSFGIASWVAVVGVILAWVLIKVDGEIETAETVTSSSVLSVPLQREHASQSSSIQLGDAAFAAGDIVTPANDNALYYYQQALASDPTNADAKRGMSQVMEFLLNEAEAAIFRSDWELARDTAAKVLALQPNHKHATDLNRRAVRLQRVEKLVDRAVALYAAGRLTLPAEDNAAAVYQEVLKLDPGNAAAKQGLESIVQRTIAHAESSMYAGKVEQANAYLERARAIDPDAPGMSTVEKTRETWTDIQQGLATKENLLAAAEALQADKLTPPAEPNAFALYSKVLSAEPDNAAAKRGLDLVRKGVLEKAQTMLATGNLRAANAHAETAEQVGADGGALNELRDEIAYQQQLLDAQAGRFDSLYPIREMTPIRQSAPAFPRTAPEGATGTVNLHFTVSITGDVRDVEVVNNPEPYFAKAASRAVEKWQFKPVMERGRPIPVRVAVRLVFN